MTRWWKEEAAQTEEKGVGRGSSIRRRERRKRNSIIRHTGTSTMCA